MWICDVQTKQPQRADCYVDIIYMEETEIQKQTINLLGRSQISQSEYTSKVDMIIEEDFAHLTVLRQKVKAYE
jgi:hypothetical protein